ASDALAATGFMVVNVGSKVTKKWHQAQKDAATVAAVGAWLYDQKFKHESQVTIRTKAVLALGRLQYKTAYPEALQKQAAWKSELGRAFEQVDFIVLPRLKHLPPHVHLFGGTVAFEPR